ncbi:MULTISPECIES: ABC transporter ATP-binding protein [unclassified Shewanella]|uniref:ABC transporter ATP-binding protein n=1 Tax=unclassified Shewanella TaxID=196818 RepID=UPI00059F73DB|nr:MULTISPECIES: ABC transporter ATP-binding protein [unclassified Shewanella]KIO36744.1 ABC transporter ATP-binding protein [Shewanella sp. cp20]MCG9745223.1 ABC transporter ATP-binding protein [Shewanella sp. Isolate8]
MTSVATLSEISKGFNDGDKFHLVLDRLDLRLALGETVALTGPSGSGKSTLLNIIAGFERPSSGTLSLLDQDTRGWDDSRWSQFRHRQLGVVFQQFNLLTPLNVADNIAFPLHLQGDDWNPWCDHLADALGLRPLLKRHVDALSGGQQQRVAIARALAHKPALLLADEPTGNLDQTTSLEVMELICALAGEHDTSILMVTHSMECADFMQRRWHLDLGRVHE